MLDVHILTLPSSRTDWLEQCITTVRFAAARAGFPVDVHVVDGVAGHLGRARELGYRQGSQPYVTHVDHDDYVDEGAFAVLGDALRSGKDAVTTGERAVYESGLEQDCPQTRHHLAVYRRAAMPMDFPQYRYYPDQYLLSRFVPEHIAQCVYVHRIYTNSASRIQRRGDAHSAELELQRIRRPDLFVAEAMSADAIAQAYDKMLGDL